MLIHLLSCLSSDLYIDFNTLLKKNHNMSRRVPLSSRPLFLKGLPNSRVLKQYANLNNIANYPNSAIKLSNDISKIELIFKKLNSNGHMGIKQFWKYNLRTINFHNPSIPINVMRVDCKTKEEQVKCPSIINIVYANGEKKTLDCKNKLSDDIMKEFTELTNSEKVPENEIPILKTESLTDNIE